MIGDEHHTPLPMQAKILLWLAYDFIPPLKYFLDIAKIKNEVKNNLIHDVTHVVSNLDMNSTYLTIPSWSRGTLVRRSSKSTSLMFRSKRPSTAARNCCWVKRPVSWRSILLQYNRGKACVKSGVIMVKIPSVNVAGLYIFRSHFAVFNGRLLKLFALTVTVFL